MTPTPDPAGRTALRSYLIARVLSAVAAAAYAVDSPGRLGLGFWLVFAAAAAGGAAVVALSFTDKWRSLRPEFTLPIDLAALGILLALSGGAQSELRHLILAMMIAPAIIMSPRVVALTGFGALAAYLAVAVPDLAQREPDAGSAVLSYVLGLLWATGTAVALSLVRARVAAQIGRLTEGRRVLLGAVLDAEARERRMVTETLHEGALQHLLAARQELDEVPAASVEQQEAIERAEAEIRAGIAALRETIAELHPVALEHAGLDAGLRAIVHRAADRGGLLARVEVAAGAEGVRDQLVANVARELITNVVEHARASTLTVRARPHGNGVVLLVEDDGVGFEPAALGTEAIGLAACAERVASADGSFTVDSTPGAGTRVRVELGPALERPPLAPR